MDLWSWTFQILNYIQARNTLVHVDEPAEHMIGPNDESKLKTIRSLPYTRLNPTHGEW